MDHPDQKKFKTLIKKTSNQCQIKVSTKRISKHVEIKTQY